MFWPFVLKLPLLVVYLSADCEIRLCALNRLNNLYAGVDGRLTCRERAEMLTELLEDVKILLSPCDTVKRLKESAVCGSLFGKVAEEKRLCSTALPAICISPRIFHEPEKEICIILFPRANHLCHETTECNFQRWKTFLLVFPG